ncbi:hypothetical protein HF675_20805 [Serratia sp. JUb9]|uniref:Wadjet anti-phage system protein JetD domain-containing protein n=1 Tax=Serratia sp. JUb9 TaxID=2724469 RepID=UPI00164D0E14|nr:Wadjet anti-phage system protein JetD domain-containing protein [Serratia sp. JUb9]QNK31981.1 hypothetical protein HF675_20805 [Serratia sp. JUb9]
MNAPGDLRKKLTRQWYNAKVRSERLLFPHCWPLRLSIGSPTPKALAERPQRVQQHIQLWRQVDNGQVEWGAISYRASAAPIEMPLRWILNGPSDWVKAAADPNVSQEFRLLEEIIEHVDTVFHPLLIRQRSLWHYRDPQEVITAAKLALRLTPGCAKGRPLRLISGQGVDTKFIEKNTPLLTRLLDERFAGEVSEQGLTTFLDAYDENSHWVLITPLSAGLLPFKRSKITTAELATTPLPASRVLVVENEKCLHQLTELADTIAILGAGLDLQWLSAPSFDDKSIAYWGDMDSWGLLMLAKARQYRPTVSPLLMNRELFDHYAEHSAVYEPITAQETPPEGLLHEEAEFYRYLIAQQRGRLEQEFIPVDVVLSALRDWVDGIR